MGALNEVREFRWTRGEPQRRWFRSDDLDLIVWCDEAGMLRGFQLFYDKPRSKWALTWLPELGFLHAAVHNGEDVGARKQTPIPVGNGHFDAKRVSERFAGASAQMPPEIAGFVDAKLRQHHDYAPRAETNGRARATAATPRDAHEASRSTNPEMREGGGEHSRDSGEFPVGLIPIFVPMLAVLLALCAYIILGAVL